MTCKSHVFGSGEKLSGSNTCAALNPVFLNSSPCDPLLCILCMSSCALILINHASLATSANGFIQNYIKHKGARVNSESFSISAPLISMGE